MGKFSRLLTLISLSMNRYNIQKKKVEILAMFQEPSALSLWKNNQKISSQEPFSLSNRTQNALLKTKKSSSSKLLGRVLGFSTITTYSNKASIAIVGNRYLSSSSYKRGSRVVSPFEVKDIYADIICKESVLLKCYHEVCGPEPLDVSKSEIMLKNLHESLVQNTFEFQPIKKIDIRKPDGSLYFIGVPILQDKIVKAAMICVLNHTYDHNFLRYSHDFRPGGTHAVLSHVPTWSGIRWFLKGDLSDCFDTLKHEELAKLLQKKIDSKPFMDLYWKAVQAGYINLTSKSREHSYNVVPRNTRLPQVLANIYLHELDLFFEEKIKRSKKSGNTSRRNPAYNTIHSKISNLRAAFSLTEKVASKSELSEEGRKERKARLNVILKLEKERAKLPSTLPTSAYRLYYIRYADDILIGLNGGKHLLVELQEELENFISEEMKLNVIPEKLVITGSKDRTYFLGAVIRALSSTRNSEMPLKKNLFAKNGRRIRARIPRGQIRLFLPLEEIVKNLRSQGFCIIKNFKNRDVIPQKKNSWINSDLPQIIEKFNKVWNDILNYYSFAYNRSQLNYVQYILLHSLACTLMDKLKLNSRRRVFKIYGSDININKRNGGPVINFNLQKSLTKLERFSKKTLNDPFDSFKEECFKKKSILGIPCSLCETKFSVRTYKRKFLKGRLAMTSLKGKYKGHKEIPLCRSCYMTALRFDNFGLDKYL